MLAVREMPDEYGELVIDRDPARRLPRPLTRSRRPSVEAMTGRRCPCPTPRIER